MIIIITIIIIMIIIITIVVVEGGGVRTCIAAGSSVRKRQMSAAFSAARARDRFILKKCGINVRNIRSYLENRKWFSKLETEKFFNGFLSMRGKPTHTPYCVRVCVRVGFYAVFAQIPVCSFFKTTQKLRNLSGVTDGGDVFMGLLC